MNGEKEKVQKPVIIGFMLQVGLVISVIVQSLWQKFWQKSSNAYVRKLPFAYPIEYMILSAPMIFKWFIIMLLKLVGLEYDNVVQVFKPPK